MSGQPLYVPGGVYHIYNHANGHENMFEKPDNYFYFLKKYSEKLDDVVRTLAYCLMPNHFHLLVEVRERELLLDFWENKKAVNDRLSVPGDLKADELFHFIVHRQFHNFLGGYAKAFNKYTGREGSLLRQNTRRKMVAEPNYLMNAIRYLHLNPVYHGFTALPEEWPHSSYHAYVSFQPTRLPREEVLAWYGGREAFSGFTGKRWVGVWTPGWRNECDVEINHGDF